MKPFSVSKDVVRAAYDRVRTRKKSVGIDKQTISDFESSLESNLYQIWHDINAGSYEPSPLRVFYKPKKSGGHRMIGITTVRDSIAERTLLHYLNRFVSPHFHPHSYQLQKRGHIHAVKMAAIHCNRYNWVLCIDVKSFADSLNWTFLEHILAIHIKSPSFQKCMQRFVQVPFHMPNGERLRRKQGVPTGLILTDTLGNLFLHHLFDQRMKRIYPNIAFERYLDDIIIHCPHETDAQKLHDHIKQHFYRYQLNLNTEKTKIIYCKDDRRTAHYKHTSFEFLGYKFQSTPTHLNQKKRNLFLPQKKISSPGYTRSPLLSGYSIYG
ncbi:hypothetical protein IC620_02230 [Hazenella sp. IB182357]|uniref:Reverse transcriptase domain-containing protein n=1 Tax=Polycladospora coralii TaxID=2771432 RepID=A0A926RW67_9BACL|nr:reverse transcriptase domain-containing protein [Polycladospora coralii]MBD1371176.1 hypothetical protein [Polycladospora coralii]